MVIPRAASEGRHRGELSKTTLVGFSYQIIKQPGHKKAAKKEEHLCIPGGFEVPTNSWKAWSLSLETSVVIRASVIQKRGGSSGRQPSHASNVGLPVVRRLSVAKAVELWKPQIRKVCGRSRIPGGTMSS